MTSIIIFTCTWYPNTSDLRFRQCLETLKKAAENSFPIVVVDGSPSEQVHAALGETGAIVCRQADSKGGKGAALREAAAIAAKNAAEDSNITLLCWQEPEKTDMITKWRDVYEALGTEDDIVVPRRAQQTFQSSYPIEQYYSESYGNLYLDAVMKDAILENQERGGNAIHWPRMNDEETPPRGTATIDWHFGPFAFRARHLPLWTAYTGNSYDAQLVPIVHGLRKGLSVCTVNVDFTLDKRMKEQEENNVVFIEKRLKQLSDLDPKVKLAWSDEPYC